MSAATADEKEEWIKCIKYVFTFASLKSHILTE